MTIRIFVGCSANGEDAEAQGMLEYTLKRYATAPLDITWMKLSKDPSSPFYANFKTGEGWNTRTWATPFSALRWAIPYICNFEGKAIYVDVDMIARDDINNLWRQEHPPGKAILAKDDKHTCVMLFDNAAIKPALPPFEQLRRTEGLYRKVRNNVASITAPFAGNWNCLDGESYKSLMDRDIKLIHFTRVETQPHLKWALPRLKKEGLQHWNRQAVGHPHARSDVQPLVDNLWKEAQAAGYTVDKYVPAAEDRFGNYDAVRGGQRAA